MLIIGGDMMLEKDRVKAPAVLFPVTTVAIDIVGAIIGEVAGVLRYWLCCKAASEGS